MRQSHSVARSITVDFESTNKGSNPFGTIHSKSPGVLIPRPHNMATAITPHVRKQREGIVHVPSPSYSQNRAVKAG